MTVERTVRIRVVALLLLLLVDLISSRASAHTIGLSKGDYVASVRDSEVTVELSLSRVELATSIGGLDANRDGTLDAPELEPSRSRAILLPMLERGLGVESDGACAASFDSATLAEADGVIVRARYRCPAIGSTLRVRFSLASSLSPGHRHVAHLALDGASADDVLRAGHEDVSVVRSDRANGSRPHRAGPWAWLGMGVEHILTGYDHLVFLFGLVLGGVPRFRTGPNEGRPRVGGRLRSLVGAVTAFTIAHSITLAVAVLGLWAPPTRLVEVAIAGSIVWVGVENLFVPDARGRWRITLPFGLVHGFGFAAALRSIALSRAQVPMALALFNAGVEIGQLAVMMLVLSLLGIARHSGWLARKGTLAMNGAVAIAGAVWFVVRLTS